MTINQGPVIHDFITREVLFEIMQEFCNQRKLIRLTKATLVATECKLQIHGSDPLDIVTSLRQGDRVSTILFNLAL